MSFRFLKINECSQNKIHLSDLSSELWRGQWFSTLTCISITWRAFKHRPQVADLVGLGWARTFKFLTFQHDADAAGPGNTL